MYSIRDQVFHLRQQNKELLKMLEDEIASRKKLEAFVKNHVASSPSANVQQPQQQSDLEGTSI